MLTQANIIRHALQLLEIYVNNHYFDTVDKNTNINVMRIPEGIISFDYADNGIYRRMKH